VRSGRAGAFFLNSFTSHSASKFGAAGFFRAMVACRGDCRMRRKPGELWGTGWGPLVVLLSLAFYPGRVPRDRLRLQEVCGSSSSSSGGSSSGGTAGAGNASTSKQQYFTRQHRQAGTGGRAFFPLSLDQAIRMGLQ